MSLSVLKPTPYVRSPWASPEPADLVGVAWEPSPGGGVAFWASDGHASGRVGVLAQYLEARPGAVVAVVGAGEFLRAADAGPAAAAVWALAAAGRLYDIALLAELARLAQPRSHTPFGGDSAGVPAVYLAEAVRSRCSDLLDTADGTRSVWPGPAALPRSGPLGLTAEVMAVLAVAQSGGVLRVDPGRREAAVRECEARRDRAAERLREIGARLDWLPFRKGRVVTGATGYPQTDPDKLKVWLEAECRSLQRVHGLPVPVRPFTDLPSGGADLAADAWRRAANLSEPIAAWAEMTAACRLRGELTRPEVTLAFETFPALRSRAPDFEAADGPETRGAFTPADGESLLVLALPDLELRSLAFCLGRPGVADRLGEWFAAGEDPAQRVAMHASGVGPERFARMFADDRVAVGRWLGLARVALRYLPLGVEPKALRWLARCGVGSPAAMSEVTAVVNAVADLIPELAGYLADDTAGRVAENLGTSVADLNVATAASRDEADLSAWLTDVFLGRGPFRDRVDLPAQLAAAFENVRCLQDAASLDAGRDDYRGVTGRDHAAPTGRVLGHATPWEAVGTDHLAVADAVMKRAAFACAAGGFPLAGVRRDELIVRAPSDRAVAPGLLVEAAVAGLLGIVPVRVVVGRPGRA